MPVREGRLIENAYHCLTSAALPALLARGIFNKEWRTSLPERLGRGGWLSEPQKAVPLWIHAASVGELTGVYPLARELEAAVPLRDILVTTTSVTGRSELLKRDLFGEPHLLPFDQPSIQRRVIERVTPRLVAVAETEIWPAFLAELARRKIPAVLFNARISDYSFDNYLRFRRVFERPLRSFARILVQTETDRERFALLGVDPAKLTVAGSTKYDLPPLELSEDELRSFATELGLNPTKPCFVAGSVRPDEDHQVVQAYLQALRAQPGLQMIIAPRHPDRFSAVAKLLESEGIIFNRRSEGAASEKRLVLLLDTLGELRKCCALAAVSFVGGTLVNIGGHNPLEPAAFGVPVLMGPYTSNVRDAVAELKREGGFVEVQDAASLAEALSGFLLEPARRLSAGQAARLVAERNQGAAKRVASILTDFLRSGAAW